MSRRAPFSLDRIASRRAFRSALFLGAVACAPVLAACNSLVGIEPFVVYEGGSAGVSSTSVSSTGGSSTGSGGTGGTGGTSSSTTGSGATGGSLPGLGKAVQLDGSDDFLSFPDTDAFTSSTAFTWELWFRGDAFPMAASTGRGATLLGAMDGAGCEDIYLGFGSETSPERELAFVVDGLGGCGVRDMDPVRYVPVGGFLVGKWYHVAAVADYTTQHMRLYVDGALVSDKPRSITPVHRTVQVHAGHWSDSTQAMAYFSGRIDELRVYGEALGEATIAKNYNDGTGTYGTASDEGIVAGWHFDEGAGTQLTPFVGGAIGKSENGAGWATGIIALP